MGKRYKLATHSGRKRNGQLTAIDGRASDEGNTYSNKIQCLSIILEKNFKSANK